MLELLKKHYEKVLLLVILLIFAGMMISLLDILRSTSAVTEKDLNIETPNADYVPADRQDRSFNLETIFTSIPVTGADKKVTERKLAWEKTPPRDPAYKEFSTDLTEMFKAATCPHEKCGRVVPLFYFSGKTCPLCKQELAAPKRPDPVVEGAVQISADQDTDKDGIPDLVEKKYELDPEKGDDALADLDGDGFSNLYEYVKGTDMRDPLKHPPLYQGLRVLSFEKTELPDRLLQVSSSGTSCQLESEQIKGDRKVRRSVFCTKGKKVMLDGQEYTVAKITRKTETKGLATKDVSEVVFTCGEDTITMMVNEPAYAPHQKVTLQLIFDGATKSLKKGNPLSLGSPEVGVEKYVVRDLNPLRENIVIENTETKKTVTIGKDYLIPEKYRLQREVKTDAGQEMENGPMDRQPENVRQRAKQNEHRARD